MFDGRVVLVTGASRGIGRKIAYEFAKKNAVVVINYLKNSTAATEIYDEIRVFSEKAMLYQADVSSYVEVKTMFDAVFNKLGKVDILVNNAGVNDDKLFINSKKDDWERTVNVNLMGVMNCCHCALIPMMRQKKGKIINISSVSVNDGKLGQSYYAASKSAVLSFSAVLAKEVGRWNINVNTIVPGLIKSDMTEKIIEKQIEEELKKIPLKKIGMTEDVAEAVLFLAGEGANYITGSVINVDGGISA